MLFSIGQRIKKNRGSEQIGITGVVDHFVKCEDGCPMMVKLDQPGWVIVEDKRVPVPAGYVCRTNPDLWDPIVYDGAVSSRYTAEELFFKFGIGMAEESKALVIYQPKEVVS